MEYMYVADKDDPRAEEDVMFKSLFVINLYPTVRKPLILLVDVDFMSTVELRQLVIQNRDSERVGTNKTEYASVLETGITVRHPIKWKGQN